MKKIKKIDDSLIISSFSRIRDIYLNNATNSYKEIGDYLAKKFFDGDIEKIKKKKFEKDKGKSFHRLCEKLKDADTNLPKKSYLYNSLGLHVDHHDLKDTELFHTYGKLSVSHQIQLLTVRDLEKKKELIQEIGDNPCSVRDLKEKIKDILPKKKNSSEKSDIEKFLDRLEKQLEKKLQQLDDLSSTNDDNTAISAIQDEMSRTIDLIAECRENSKTDS